MLRYTVNAQVGGKIAQLGARLIDSTAKSMAGQFFTKFAARLETVPSVPHDIESEPAPAIDAPVQFETLPPDAPVQQRSNLIGKWRALIGQKS
ncbi:MAG: SRPBCC domain-containing protein [Aliidongia sp.]